MSAELRLYPDRLGKVPRTGAVESVQEAELRLRCWVSVVHPDFLDACERAGAAITDGRLTYAGVDRSAPLHRPATSCVVLIPPVPLDLLRLDRAQ